MELVLTAFGAIGGTVGAVATFTAVVVALWQTKISYKKKLQLSFTDDIAVVPENGSGVYRYIGVGVTNVGNRDVVIQNWGFICHDKSKMLIVPDTSRIGRMLQTQLPHKLQVEEGMTLYYDKTLFHLVLDEHIKKGSIKPKKRINFYVTDSTSKVYYTLTKKTQPSCLMIPNLKNSICGYPFESVITFEYGGSNG